MQITVACWDVRGIRKELKRGVGEERERAGGRETKREMGEAEGVKAWGHGGSGHVLPKLFILFMYFFGS